jgi:hypothetical protein
MRRDASREGLQHFRTAQRNPLPARSPRSPSYGVFGMKIARIAPVKKTHAKAKPRAKAKKTRAKSPTSRVKKAA